MNRLRPLPFLFLLLLLGLGSALPAHAQLSVEIKIKRHTFIRYEPILATVIVTNLAGRDLTLSDTDGNQWFGFQINSGDSAVPPINPNYHLDDLQIKTGQTVKRTVNLSELFAFSEFAHYRVKGTIYSRDYQKFFSSKLTSLDVSEGHVVWQQAVGVPEGRANAGSTHVISVLEFQSDEKKYLYARIEDRESSTVFCTHKLGHVIDSVTPEIQLDAANNLFVLQMVEPTIYLLTKISVNGDFETQNSYTAAKSRPHMRRLADGQLQLVGAHRDIVRNGTPGGANDPAEPPIAKLSARPAGLPKN